MHLATFVAAALQLSARNTCRQQHRLISNVRPHVQHTDFKPRETPFSGFALEQEQAFQVVLMSSDLRPTLTSNLGDILIVTSPLYLVIVVFLLETYF